MDAASVRNRLIRIVHFGDISPLLNAVCARRMHPEAHAVQKTHISFVHQPSRSDWMVMRHNNNGAKAPDQRTVRDSTQKLVRHSRMVI